MIWFFEKRGAYVRCEAREAAPGRYELVITQPDGTEQIETFEDSTEMTRRQVQVEQGLSADGWTGPHGRVM